MQQAHDFIEECLTLDAIVSPPGETELATPTLFKSWTIADILGHLHMFNRAATLTATDEGAFRDFITALMAEMKAGRSLREIQDAWLDGLSGRALVDAWRAGCAATARAYANIDPKARLAWAGPDMSARSCITARQMETWAHGQAVFDALGADRVETDRIRNIAHLGVTTYRWSFANRGEDPPGPPPYVRLTAPSGVVWEWNAPREGVGPDDPNGNRVEGPAVDFCRVVTQTRNVADTALHITGAAAARWMAVAQCFAGPPENPPMPGTRRKAAPRRGG
jgi:uncharacterized protein (TIGR03084 family)